MMLAGALGDALGAPHEFGKGGYTGILEFTIHIPSKYHSKSLPVGAVTDDSEMAIIIWRCIREEGKYNRDRVLMDYLDWCTNHSVARGKNTAALMKGIKTIRGYNARFAKIFKTDMERESAQSNGCLMRCGPLAMLSAEELPDAVKEDCYLTNPNGTCYESVLIYTRAIAMALNGSSKTEISKFIKDAGVKTNIVLLREAIEGAFADTHRDVSKRPTKGWVLHALHIALWTFFHHNNFTNGIKAVIEAGGDTDTNGAIYGYLAGAYEGLDSIKLQQASNISKLKDGFWKINEIL